MLALSTFLVALPPPTELIASSIASPAIVSAGGDPELAWLAEDRYDSGWTLDLSGVRQAARAIVRLAGWDQFDQIGVPSGQALIEGRQHAPVRPRKAGEVGVGHLAMPDQP